MNSAEREQLMAEFSAFLDQMEEPELSGQEDAGREVDLYSLLTEMATLKNEVRLEARQFKSALEELRRFGDELSEHGRKQEAELARCREESTAARRRLERSFLFELVDLRDRLRHGVEAGGKWPSSWLDRFHPAAQRFAIGIREGQLLTLQRLDDLLSGHGVHAIPALGQRFHPERMHAVAVEACDGENDGRVVREIRSGYLHQGEVLRVAEVIVSKNSDRNTKE